MRAQQMKPVWADNDEAAPVGQNEWSSMHVMLTRCDDAVAANPGTHNPARDMNGRMIPPKALEWRTGMGPPPFIDSSFHQLRDRFWCGELSLHLLVRSNKAFNACTMLATFSFTLNTDLLRETICCIIAVLLSIATCMRSHLALQAQLC